MIQTPPPSCTGSHRPQPRLRLHVRLFLVLASLPLLLFLTGTGIFMLQGMESILTSTASIRTSYLPAVFAGHRSALDVEKLRRHALTVYMSNDAEVRRAASLTAAAIIASALSRSDSTLYASLIETGDLLVAIQERKAMGDTAKSKTLPPLLKLEELLASTLISPDISATNEWQAWQAARLHSNMSKTSTQQELRVMQDRMKTFIDQLMLTPAGSRISPRLFQNMILLLEEAITAHIQVLEADSQTQRLWEETEQSLGFLCDKLNANSVELTYETLNSIDAQTLSLEHLIYGSVALVFFSFITMSILLHIYIVRPITRTSDKLQNIRTGRQSAPLEPIRVAELNEVSTLINMFSEQLSVMYQHARNLEREKDHIESLAITDALTGIYNRRYFDIQFKLIGDEARMQGKPLSIVMLDIDLFKVYNDTLGHSAGDECLVLVARALRSSLLRTSDRVFRYGGEEFVVLLPDCPPDAAQLLAERIRNKVQELGIIHPGSSVAPFVTVSIGVSTSLPEAPLCGTPLLDLADSAMYRSKFEGRNRVTMSVAACADTSATASALSPSKESSCTD